MGNNNDLNQEKIKATSQSLKEMGNAIINTLKPIMETIETFAIAFNKVLIEIAKSPGFQEFMTMMLALKLESDIIDNCWLVLDNELWQEIIKHKLEQGQNVDSIIIDFYSRNNFEKVAKFTQELEDMPFIQKRLAIIKSALNIMLNNNREDASNVVIPTLMVQITGIIEQDIYESIPSDLLEKIKAENGTTSKRMIIVYYLWENGLQQYAWKFSEIIHKKTFLSNNKPNKLTQAELDKYNKFRPKILHGDIDFLNYGSNKNLIHSWLELSFTISIKKELVKIQETNQLQIQ